ncbi:MAG: HAMP domain-containing sensor histidine kinase [Desulfomonilaceae bacterium]|nr:HAMP domain-containing sensor histidine kinase [Desulfomonilaceae bacterium]
MSKQKCHSGARPTRSRSAVGNPPDSLDSLEGLSIRRHTAAECSNEAVSLGALFAGIHHELSNPLANIRMAGEVLLEDLEELEGGQNAGALDMEYVKYKLSGIVREVDRAGSLLRELSQISRVNDLETEWVNLKGLLDRVAATMLPRIPPQVKVTVRVNADVYVGCDEQMLTTAFVNLVSDAAAAVGDQGEVILEERMDSGDVVEITVENTGSAPSDRHLEEIFEPFVSTRKAGRGKGLGLFVSFRIVKSHNGTIWAESISGRGMTIKLRLPAKRIE